ncbi:MYND-type zinc finger-containing chromatin reader Zmynd8-like [Phlebotomus argentipes]|uniref:MYND-type zinc finger-containing chromatin reader Zmynd8-like n=1 Tax=Phlebotomus argentipes TaxID=94469 RepID=UPI00289318EF|nr:MYND-type zinc finger-containing chromatin reader Zmynd8-like [Phlebotomus argentipes]
MSRSADAVAECLGDGDIHALMSGDIAEMEQEVITEDMEVNTVFPQVDAECANGLKGKEEERRKAPVKSYAIKKRENASSDRGANASEGKMVIVKLLPSFEAADGAPGAASTPVAEKADEENGEESKTKIKREMKQLHKMMKASKVLSDYITDGNHARVRKSRKSAPRGGQQRGRSLSVIDASSMRLNFLRKSTGNAEDLGMQKRSNMRSQNAEFTLKQQKFLNRIQREEELEDGDDDDEEEDEKDMDEMSDNSENESNETKSLKCTSEYSDSIPIIKISNLQKPPKENADFFCWRCHGDTVNLSCCQCVRSYHSKCLKLTGVQGGDAWTCPECVQLSETSSSTLSVDQLSTLLMFAWNRMTQLQKTTEAVENFNVDSLKKCESYIKNPVTLADLKTNIRTKKYKATHDFMMDVKWILHNCYVYYTCVTPFDMNLLKVVKSLVRVCKQEMNEIETCSECYYNANTQADWFVEVCTKPHILLWAKLKGFPYWPAKGMAVNGATSVDVRFFGAHDRAWVPLKECYLYSEKNPSQGKTKRNNIERCIKEIDVHIAKIKDKFGVFNYPDFRTPYDPQNEVKQLQMMIPTYNMSDKKPLAKLLNATSASPKNNLTYRIIKTADNNLSIAPVVKKTEPMNGVAVKMEEEESEVPEEKHAIPEVKPTKIVISRKKYLDVMASQAPTKTILESKSYQAVKKPQTCATEQRKVDCVIIKRKSSNWNAVPSKRSRMSCEDAEEAKQKDVAEQQVSSSDDLVKMKESNTTSNSSSSSSSSSSNIGKKSVEVAPDPVAGPSRVKMPPDSTKQKKSEEKEVESLKGKVKSPESDVNSSQSSASATPPSDCSSSTSTITKKPIVISTGNLFDNEEIRFEQSPSKATESETSIMDTALISLPQISIIRNKSAGNASGEEKKSVQETSSAPSSSSSAVSGQNEVTTTEAKKSVAPVKESAQEIRRRTRSGNCPPPGKKDVREESTKVPENVSITNQGEEEKQESALTRSKTSRITNSNQETTEKIIDTVGSSTRKSSREPESVTPPSNVIDLDVEEVRIKSEPISDTEDSSRPPSVPLESRTDKPVGRAKGRLQHRPFVARNAPGFATRRSRKINTDKIQRARKSFPTSLRAHVGALNNLEAMNSMVYIPMDSNLKRLDLESSTPGPVPPLAAVVKEKNSSGLPIPPLVPTKIAATETSHMLSGIVTQSLANAITDTIVKGPPKLMSKPTGTLRSEGDSVFPSEAGPACQLLIDNAHKMTDFFRTVIEDTLGDLAKNGCLDAKVKMLEMEIEKLKFAHNKEITQLKNSTDLILCEMKNSVELEKTRVINETRKQCEIERIRAVEETKKKQWCVNCGKEAQFYCCWNTSYCDYPCQQQHWSRHMNSCAQNESNSVENRLSQKNHTRTASQGASGSKAKESNLRNINSGGNRNSLVRNPTSVQRTTVPSTNSSPCYALVPNRHGHGWEMVSGSQANISNSLLPSSMVLNQQTSSLLSGSVAPMTAAPQVTGSGAIIDGILITPDTYLLKK